MLRDKNLVPLSHQHQHALALCVRLDRALQSGEVDANAWQAEIQQQFQQEVCVHFEAEEKEIFPAAERFPELQTLIAELRVEHGVLRALFSRAESRSLNAAGLEDFIEKLARHIRKEERQLFEALQTLMNPEELEALGEALEKTLAGASKVCALPNEAARRRPKP